MLTDQSPQRHRLDRDLLAVEVATAQQQVGDLQVLFDRS